MFFIACKLPLQQKKVSTLEIKIIQWSSVYTLIPCIYGLNTGSAIEFCYFGKYSQSCEYSLS